MVGGCPPTAISGPPRLRLLLSGLGAPAAISGCLRALPSKPGKAWDDGPDAITSIRNALVHPRENVNLPEDAYYEAWQLSMWFLDMTMPRLCGYNGTYGNRLKRRFESNVEPVPWTHGSLAELFGSHIPAYRSPIVSHQAHTKP
jgi:hypothetical protein